MLLNYDINALRKKYLYFLLNEMLRKENEAYFRTVMIFYIVPFHDISALFFHKQKHPCIITPITVMQQKYLNC